MPHELLITLSKHRSVYRVPQIKNMTDAKHFWNIEKYNWIDINQDTGFVQVRRIGKKYNFHITAIPSDFLGDGRRFIPNYISNVTYSDYPNTSSNLLPIYQELEDFYKFYTNIHHKIQSWKVMCWHCMTSSIC